MSPLRLPLLVLLGLATGCPSDKSGERDSARPDAPDDSDAPDDTDPTDDTDCDDPRTWYRDADDDGLGTEEDTREACEQPDGYVRKSGDCDDEDAEVYEGAHDDCEDGVDADCDGEDAVCGVAQSLGEVTVKLWATGRRDDAGRHMDAGDLDGDGKDELVVGEMWANDYRGGAFVLSSPQSESGALSEAGLELSGDRDSFEGGRSIGVADGDGDGNGDLLLGAPDAEGYDAVVFLGPVVDGLSFSDAELRTWCDEAVECGHGGDLGDIDGDGLADALIGAGEERHDGQQTGSVYVLFGPLGDRDVDLQSDADLEVAGDVRGAEAGRVVVTGGDIDGDGLGDTLVTAGADSEMGVSAGAIYVLLSPLTVSMEFSDADGKLVGGSAYSYAGEALAQGDLNGDGLSDAIVGAYATEGGDGAATVSFHPAEGTVGLDEAELVVTGSDSEGMGTGVAAEDLDGDGAAELLVGAGANGEEDRGAGAAYLFTGPASGSLGAADATAMWTGESRGDGAGSGVGFADLTGDGQRDVIVGAPGESTGADNGGALYLIAW